MARSHKRVLVVDNDDDSAIVERFSTIQEAEAFIARLEIVEPQKVHNGGYGIDYPEDMDARRARK